MFEARRARLAAIGTLVAMSMLAAVEVANAFTINRHYNLTWQVLERQGVPIPARTLIALGATLPDVEGCLGGSCYCVYLSWACPPDVSEALARSADHFDNNVFYDSIDRVNVRMLDAMSVIFGPRPDARTAAKGMLQFGRALHAVQDFYAHSSYLEINLPFVRSNGLASLPLWEGQPYVGTPWPIAGINVSDLRTGYYLIPTPDRQHHHDQIAKDSPFTPEGGRMYSGFPLNTVTSYYGAVSGDFVSSGRFGDAGLAPRHTIRAYQELFDDGVVFAFQPWYLAAQPARAPAARQTVEEFFAWASQDSAIQAWAAAAEQLAAFSARDTTAPYPPGTLDADGLPIPGVLSAEPESPRGDLALDVPAPNPSHGATVLRFRVPGTMRAELALFDVRGRRVATLFDAAASPGWNDVHWDPRQAGAGPVGAGVYFARLSAGGFTRVRRVVLIP